MEELSAGYREVEHTADWQLEVWAPGLRELLVQAAQGMYALAGARLQEGPEMIRHFEVSASDPEEFLVSFLSELLYYSEQESLAFDTFELSLDEDGVLKVEAAGRPLASLHKDIKAVTYHGLRLDRHQHGLQARIVFDV